jgi:hypothetical protein
MKMSFTVISGDYEDVFLGRDNTFDVVVKKDGIEFDLSDVTSVTLKIGSVTIDSSVSTDAFDWTSGSGVLICKLGGEALNIGSYNAILCIFDATNTNGIYVGSFKVRIQSV